MNEFDSVLENAEKQCKENSSRLTPKRKKILQELLKSGKALSAYEIADRFQKKSKESIPTMSVYRILDFLEDENLVHKLNLANKYIACAHISCNHSHSIPQFLVCRICTKVSEISIDMETMKKIKKKVEEENFYLTKPQLEMHCICKACNQENK
jgi:Fur family zinc uptake transcriptional regulator